LFQQTDLLADRALRQIQCLRSLGEAEQARRNVKRAQGAEYRGI
jgi:hypothetical protein